MKKRNFRKTKYKGSSNAKNIEGIYHIGGTSITSYSRLANQFHNPNAAPYTEKVYTPKPIFNRTTI